MANCNLKCLEAAQYTLWGTMVAGTWQTKSAMKATCYSVVVIFCASTAVSLFFVGARYLKISKMSGSSLFYSRGVSCCVGGGLVALIGVVNTVAIFSLFHDRYSYSRY